MPVVTGPPVTKQLEYLHYVRVIKTVLFKNSGPFLAALTKLNVINFSL